MPMQDEELVEEETKTAKKVKERQRLVDNEKAFDKKLSDFERMFLFINEELDFKQLSELEERTEQHRQSHGRSEDGETSLGLNVTDMYGFIRQGAAIGTSDAGEEGKDIDDFEQRMSDRFTFAAAQNTRGGSPVMYKKQAKLNARTDSSSSQLQSVTSFGNYVKGSIKVMNSMDASALKVAER